MSIAHRVLASLLAIAHLAPAAGAGAQRCEGRDVPAQEIRAAMRLHGDYDIRATMNSARFGAEVILRLAKWAQERQPEGGPLILRHDAWFESFLEVGGMRAEDAPIGARKAYEYRQDMHVEYRADRVIADTGKGPAPRMALRVTAFLPDDADTPAQYSYADHSSIPRLRATVGRVVQFHLLEYDDRVVYDEMTGISGRPVSGPLGAIFAALGDARIESSQIGIAADGTQVMVARARWLFSKSATATIKPDGRGEKGVPDTPELRRLAKLLRVPPALEYISATC